MIKNILNAFLIISLAAAIIASFLKLMHFHGSNFMLLATLPALAISAFAKNAADATFKGFLTGLAIAWACMAVLFKLLQWPNGDLMSKSTFVIGAVWMVYTYFISPEEKTE